MRKSNEDLLRLKESLVNLLCFIDTIENGNVPDFYRYFDTMKHNIDIFFYTGSNDIEDFLPVLERDWDASHMVLLGVQYYDPRHSNPELDVLTCLQYAQLLADVERFFENAIEEEYLDRRLII